MLKEPVSVSNEKHEHQSTRVIPRKFPSMSVASHVVPLRDRRLSGTSIDASKTSAKVTPVQSILQRIKLPAPGATAFPEVRSSASLRPAKTPFAPSPPTVPFSFVPSSVTAKSTPDKKSDTFSGDRYPAIAGPSKNSALSGSLYREHDWDCYLRTSTYLLDSGKIRCETVTTPESSWIEELLEDL